MVGLISLSALLFIYWCSTNFEKSSPARWVAMSNQNRVAAHGNLTMSFCSGKGQERHIKIDTARLQSTERHGYIIFSVWEKKSRSVDKKPSGAHNLYLLQLLSSFVFYAIFWESSWQP
jgi:hypothetical protein